MNDFDPYDMGEDAEVAITDAPPGMFDGHPDLDVFWVDNGHQTPSVCVVRSGLQSRVAPIPVGDQGVSATEYYQFNAFMESRARTTT